MTDTLKKQVTFRLDNTEDHLQAARDLAADDVTAAVTAVDAAHLLQDLINECPLGTLLVAAKILLAEEAQWKRDLPELTSIMTRHFELATELGRQHYHEHVEAEDQVMEEVAVELPADSPRFLALAEGSKLKN